jgi:peptidoglycan hydrolase-like protein with peptidoglycan-binding domain
MTLKRLITSISVVGAMFVLSFAVANATSALTASCVGVPTASSITWTASSSGGVAPIAFLWGNGSTSPVQTIAVSPGMYSMTLQATDASSTVATTTCSATVVQSIPTITSFVANPSTITSGQSSVLSWVVSNASSTSLDNGIGVVTGTSITVTPSMTTTYHLSAVNPVGTTTANAIVTVNATTSTGTDIQTQILNLLKQIADLKAQIVQLLQQQQSGGTGTSTPPTAGSPGLCFSFGRDLSEGNRGDDVKELQRELANDPSIFPPGLITGFFGHRTEEAMKKFQQRFGIFSFGSTTTGFFGPKTRGFLREHCGSQDNDHDGIPNSMDTDDDNDGIPDVNDAHPFIPDNVGTSTSSSSNGDHGKNEGNGGGDNRGNKGGDSHGN